MIFKTAGILALIFTFFTWSQSVYAITPPDFPSCLAPEGTQTVKYDSGLHAVVGKHDSSVQGADSVYKIDDQKTIQCLCTSDGTGIQTNWWKSSSLTDDDRKILESLGWIYIPNGLLWGLDDSSYYAKNTSYACITPTVTPTPDPGSPTPTPTNKPNNNSTNSNSQSNTSSTSTSQGQVLGASTGEVLGFAGTGNSVEIYLVGAASIMCFIIWSFIYTYGHKKSQ